MFSSKIPHASHTKIAWPRERLAAIDFIDEASRQNTVFGLLEFNVNEPLRLMREHAERTGERLSFTAFIVRCVARAVSEQKEIAAYRDGNKGLMVFDDVDVSTLIERDFDGRKHPSLHFVMQANEKSFLEIHEELRHSRSQPVDPTLLTEKRRTRFLKLPRWLRKLMLRAMRRQPLLKKFAAGTVGVTALGMMGPKGRRVWILPVSPWTLTVGVGAFHEAPAVVNGEIQICELLGLTLCFDHDIVDGGPAARFSSRLGELIEAGFDLPGGPTDVPRAAALPLDALAASAASRT